MQIEWAIPLPSTTDEVQNCALYLPYSDPTLLIHKLPVHCGLQQLDPRREVRVPLCGNDARGYRSCTDHTGLSSLAIVPSLTRVSVKHEEADLNKKRHIHP